MLSSTNLNRSFAGKQETNATVLPLVLYQDPVDIDLGGPVDVGHVPVPAVVVVDLVHDVLVGGLLLPPHLVCLPGTDNSQVI